MKSSDPSDRGAWMFAWILALMLHAAIILVLVKLPMVAVPAVAAPQPVQVRLFSQSPQAPGEKEPQFFSELPPDRADKAPKKPEFLSNVNSRARDLAAVGSAVLPRMEGSADAPMVKLEPGKHSSPAQAAQPKRTPSAEAQPKDGSKEKEQAELAALGFALPSPHQREAPRAANSDDLDGSSGSGNSDIPQPEMDNPNGRAELTGDVSLSTTAWDYAPWLQRFGRKVMDGWIAPTAYRIGLLKEGGWAVVTIEIARSGQALRFQPLENRGHSSLIIAAQSALRNALPAPPLPADFPDSTLTLRVRMIYPRIPSP